MSDEGKGFFKLDYVITVSREGQSIKDKVVYGPGMKFETVYRLNETKVAKDNEENPKFMYKVDSSLHIISVYFEFIVNAQYNITLTLHLIETPFKDFANRPDPDQAAI